MIFIKNLVSKEVKHLKYTESMKYDLIQASLSVIAGGGMLS